MKHGYKVSWRVAFAAPAALALTASAAPVESQSPTTPGPRYAANGDLLLPVGFENWVFVGSNLGLGYEGEPPSGEPQYHNIYINPEAYAHFLATKEFPVPTILVMAKFKAADKEPKGVVTAGTYNGDPTGLEVAVKDIPAAPGRLTPWAYYDFTNGADPSKPPSSAAPFPKEVCYDCHLVHASRDNVWVQFYPTLRKVLN